MVVERSRGWVKSSEEKEGKEGAEKKKKTKRHRKLSFSETAAFATFRSGEREQTVSAIVFAFPGIIIVTGICGKLRIEVMRWMSTHAEHTHQIGRKSGKAAGP